MQNETNSARLENVVGAPVYGARAAPRFTIAEHVHTSRGIPIFICVVDERFDCTEFSALRNQARKQGGWYFRPWESAPGGFAFMDRAAAERFAEPAGLDDAEEADSAPEPVPPIAAKLRALAEDRDGDSLQPSPGSMATASCAPRLHCLRSPTLTSRRRFQPSSPISKGNRRSMIAWALCLIDPRPNIMTSESILASRSATPPRRALFGV